MTQYRSASFIILNDVNYYLRGLRFCHWYCWRSRCSRLPDPED